MKRFTALFLTAIFFATTANAINAGMPAPDFNKPDINGNMQSISQYKGNVIVLEWTNPECPYVKKFYQPGKMQEWQKQATADGVVWLTINSGAPYKQGHMTNEAARELFASNGSGSTAYIIDADGSIGKAYGAASTPTAVVIGKDGNVAYFGAVDNKPTAKSEDIDAARNYIAEGIAAAKAGTKAAVPVTRSYGCGIKYSN